MTAAAESQLDAVVHQSFTPEPIAKTGVTQQVDGALLKNAGPDALLDVFPAARLQHNRVDALQVQQMGE
jgi:hypothetical protein